MAFGDLILGGNGDVFYTYSYVKGAWNSGYSGGGLTRNSSKGVAVSPTHGTIYAINFIAGEEYDEVLPYSRRLYGGRRDVSVKVGRRYDPIRVPFPDRGTGAFALTVPYRCKEERSAITRGQQSFRLGETFIYGALADVLMLRPGSSTQTAILARDAALSYVPRVIGLSATPDGALYTLWDHQTITYSEHGYDSNGEFDDTRYFIGGSGGDFPPPPGYATIPLPPHLSSVAGVRDARGLISIAYDPTTGDLLAGDTVTDKIYRRHLGVWDSGMDLPTGVGDPGGLSVDVYRPEVVLLRTLTDINKPVLRRVTDVESGQTAPSSNDVSFDAKKGISVSTRDMQNLVLQDGQIYDLKVRYFSGRGVLNAQRWKPEEYYSEAAGVAPLPTGVSVNIIGGGRYANVAGRDDFAFDSVSVVTVGQRIFAAFRHNTFDPGSHTDPNLSLIHI